MRRPPSSLNVALLALVVVGSGCIELGELYPYRLFGDDDDSAANDDDAVDDDDSGDDDDDDSGDDDDDDDGATPCDVSWLVETAEPISLAFQIEPLFAVNCDPCHTVQDLGGLRMSPGMAYAALVNQPNLLGYGEGMPRVTPGDAQASYLMHKLVGCGSEDPDWGHFQSTMPPPIGETVPLTQDETLLIYSWIQQGAEDN